MLLNLTFEFNFMALAFVARLPSMLCKGVFASLNWWTWSLKIEKWLVFAKLSLDEVGSISWDCSYVVVVQSQSFSIPVNEILMNVQWNIS